MGMSCKCSFWCCQVKVSKRNVILPYHKKGDQITYILSVGTLLTKRFCHHIKICKKAIFDNKKNDDQGGGVNQRVSWVTEHELLFKP